LCPRDDAHSYSQRWAREPAGDDVIIGGDIYRVTAVNSQYETAFDLRGKM